MPRVGGVMQLLSGTLAVPNTTIQSAPYNAQQNDWVLDANNPRPISAGGTGATTATAARTALGALGTGDLAAAPTKAVVVDTDSIVMIDSQASNAKKRWLVSAMKTTFGPTNHNHTKLVSTTGDVSLLLGGVPGAGVFWFNNKADGSGTNIATITETGGITAAEIASTGTITATGTIIATGAITGGSTVGVKGAANVGFGFFGPAGEDRGLIYTPGGSAGSITVRTSGGDYFFFENTGAFKAPGTVNSGSAYLHTDGNVGGSIWSSWGSTSAFNAISDRIEERGEAWANNRVSLLAYRKVTGGNSGTAASWAAPAGAVVTGYNRDSGTTGQVSNLIYEYLQAYDPVRGWVGFTG